MEVVNQYLYFVFLHIDNKTSSNVRNKLKVEELVQIMIYKLILPCLIVLNKYIVLKSIKEIDL